MSTFITVSNGIITGNFNGDIKAKLAGFEDHERIEIPENTYIATSDPVKFYTAEWQRKTEKQLISEGLMNVPEGYVLDGESLREMTYEEKNPPKEQAAEEQAEQERKQQAYKQLTEAESAMQTIIEAAMPQLLAMLDSQNADITKRRTSIKQQYENFVQQRNKAKAELE